MLRSHLDVFHTPCCNLATDLEGRANFGNPFAVGHLSLALARSIPIGELLDDERLILFISFAI